MSIELISESPEDTFEIARSLGKVLVSGDVIALTGDLGAGKTCFCKGIGAALGISSERVVSPTFTIVTEHEGTLPFTHVDVYRLDTVREAVEIGLDETFSKKDGICVVEWAEKVEELLPKDHIQVTFVISDNDCRKIMVSWPEQSRFAAFRDQIARFSARRVN